MHQQNFILFITKQSYMMQGKSRKTFFRRKSFTAKHEHRLQHAIHQHQYLMKLEKNESIYPRYDLLSQNNHNNLIVHVIQKPKLQLKPKKISQTVSKIQSKIKQLSNFSIRKAKTGTSFYSAPVHQKPIISVKTNRIQIDKKNQQQILRSQSEQYKAKYKPLLIGKSDRQKFNNSNNSTYKTKDQGDEGEIKRNLLKPILVYEQQKDKAVSMEEKLRLLYLGTRLTNKNWFKKGQKANRNIQRHNF